MKRKLESFCFDPGGLLYLASSDPSALMVMAPDLQDVLAVYERFGYEDGCIRYPRCVSVDDRGGIYLLDDSRIMKFRLVGGEDAPAETGED